MQNVIIVLVLVIIAVLAVISSIKHIKGEGGCCGGGGEIKPEKKILDGKKIAEKIVTIDGMHCDHCKNTVERYINQIDGAAAVVNLRKNIAVVSLSRDVSDDEIKRAVERADFKVVKIEKEEM